MTNWKNSTMGIGSGKSGLAAVLVGDVGAVVGVLSDRLELLGVVVVRVRARGGQPDVVIGAVGDGLGDAARVEAVDLLEALDEARAAEVRAGLLEPLDHGHAGQVAEREGGVGRLL